MHGGTFQWIGSISASLLATAVLHLWAKGARALGRINRTVAKFDTAATTIAKFGKQWEAAVRLDEEIRADRADMAALILQLGTQGRDPAWASIEAYLHEWRHEWANDRQAVALLVGVLERIADDLRTLVSSQ